MDKTKGTGKVSCGGSLSQSDIALEMRFRYRRVLVWQKVNFSRRRLAAVDKTKEVAGQPATPILTYFSTLLECAPPLQLFVVRFKFKFNAFWSCFFFSSSQLSPFVLFL